MEILVFAMILGVIPAMIANGKGRSAFGWWVYGTLIFIIALPHSLLISKYVEPEPKPKGPNIRIEPRGNEGWLAARRQAEAEAPRQPAAAISAASTAGVMDNNGDRLLAQITKLNEWRDSGRINQQQYDALLAKITQG